MDAFRSEMRETKDFGARAGKFVPSVHLTKQQEQRSSSLANEVFGLAPVGSALVEAGSDEEDYDYWPDELVPVEIGAEDAAQTSTSTTDGVSTSTTDSTAETEPTEEDSEDDYWPTELLVG